MIKKSEDKIFAFLSQNHKRELSVEKEELVGEKASNKGKTSNIGVERYVERKAVKERKR